MNNPPLLELKNIGMHFGPVQALKGVDLCVEKGDAVGICGDNGAGKSTMIKIVSGALTPSFGKLFLDGAAIDFHSPGDALRKGVATIYQDLALAPRMSIYQNIFMGSEIIRPTILPGFKILNKDAMRKAAAEYLESLKISIPSMDTWVGDLSGGQRQAVAIARVIRWQAQLVVMDEPTAALGVKETRKVLDLIHNLREAGVTIIIISHNMDDIIAVTNRVVILRNGEKVAEKTTDELSADSLAHLVMSGGMDS